MEKLNDESEAHTKKKGTIRIRQRLLNTGIEEEQLENLSVEGNLDGKGCLGVGACGSEILRVGQSSNVNAITGTRYFLLI